MNPYAEAVARQLHGLRPRDRRAAVADLEALLAEGVDPAELGPPDDYAAALRAELGREPRPRRTSRVWDPQDPHLLVPRAFGWGWRLNVGALAVRLGWLRPDDADADVVAEIPPRVRRAARLVPYALAGVTALATARAVRAGHRVPSHWGLTGRPDRFADPRWLLAPAAFATGAAVWGSLPARGDDVVTRPALAASGAATCALLATAAAAPDPGRRRRWLLPATLAVPAAVELALTVVPIRAALDRIRRGLR